MTMRGLESASSSRTSSRWVSRPARQALCLALLLALPGGAQNGAPQPRGASAQPMGQGAGDPFADADGQYSPEDERRLRALNALRQKSMVEDTNKLLKLAAELNAEVSSAHPDSLTAEQLRKLAEIEKLAHSVKDKMSTSVRPTPVFGQPAAPSLRFPTE
jgi:hypothetical protein